MATQQAEKKKRETLVITNTVLDKMKSLTEELDKEREIEITSASLKDDFCNYSYEVTKGIGVGDTHSVKGKGIIDDDLRDAFVRLNVHLAVVDDIFKHAGVELEKINKHREDELATHYTVTGIKIKGKEENLSVELIGTKFVSSAGGDMQLASPKIPLDNSSSYKFHKDLKTAVEKVSAEVILYMGGKYTAVESPDEQLPGQTNLFADGKDETDSMDDFAGAKK